MKLRPKNWEQFQHYKERRPPWIKLHRVLLDDFDYHQLPDASKALAPLLWLLASEHENGVFEYDSKVLAFRLHTDSNLIESALKPLIDSGFFCEYLNASNVLATRKQSAMPETERETYKKEREGELTARQIDERKRLLQSQAETLARQKRL